MEQSKFNLVTWIILATAVALPFIAWASSLGWNLSGLSGLQWFPLFGLLAWTIMWTHYIVALIKLKNKDLKTPKYYTKITMYFVLGFILLHPAVLIYTLYDIGLGLPPDSYLTFVGESLKIAVAAGTFSLILFLSYEVFDRLRNKSIIKKNWLFISISQSLAMTLIFVHALKLGGTVAEGWFQIVWILLGISLLPCFYIFHKQEFTDRQSQD